MVFIGAALYHFAAFIYNGRFKGMAGLAGERNESVSSCNIQIDRTGDVRPGAKPTGVSQSYRFAMWTAAPLALGIGGRREHEYSDAETAWLLEEAARLAP
jgi:L-methionine (R)-S-oxide reductase